VEDREAVNNEEREAVDAGDDVEAHLLANEDKGALISEDDSERRAFPDGN
jgi:hypothetical protein